MSYELYEKSLILKTLKYQNKMNHNIYDKQGFLGKVSN